MLSGRAEMLSGRAEMLTCFAEIVTGGAEFLKTSLNPSEGGTLTAKMRENESFYWVAVVGR